MSRVEAVFTLTDRVSKRLTEMVKKAAAAEKALERLDRQIDKTNRKLNVLQLRLAGLPRNIRIDIEANTSDVMRDIAMVKAAQRGLGGVSVGAGGVRSRGAMIRTPLRSGGDSPQMRSYLHRVSNNRSLAGAMFGGGTYVRTPEEIARHARMNERMFRSRKNMIPRILGSFDDEAYDHDSATATARRARRGAGFFGRLVGGRLNPMDNDGPRGGLLRRAGNYMANDPKFQHRLNKILAGGRGGYFRGASLGVILALSGLASGAVGLGGGGAAIAGSLLPMLAAGGGLAGVLAGGAIPLATGAKRGYDRVQSAREAVAAAKTEEELAEATKELAAAQAALTPVQKQVIADATTLKDIYKDMFGPVQQNVANILSSFTRTVTTLQPILGPVIEGFGRAGENIARRSENFMNRPGEQTRLQQFLGPLPAMSERLAEALGKVLVIIQRTTIAATPLATWILGNINEYLGGIVDRTRKGGGLESWFKGFERFKPVIKEIGLLFQALLSSLSRMFDDVIPVTVQILQILRGPFLEALEEVIRVGAKVSGPAVLGLLVEVLRFIKDNAEPLGQIIRIVALALTWLLKVINRLNEASGGGLGIIIVGGVVGLTLVLKFLSAIRRLEKILGITVSKGLLLRRIGRGMFSPMIAGAKLAIQAINKLIGRLLAAGAASETIGGPGGLGGRAGRAGRLGRLAPLLRGAGPVAASVYAGYETASILSDQPGVSNWGQIPGKIGDWFARRPGSAPALGPGSYYRGGNRPGIRAMSAGGPANSVTFNGPVNINNGTDEQQFLDNIRRAMGSNASNMPQATP